MEDKTYQLTLNMSDGSAVNVGTVTVPGGGSSETSSDSGVIISVSSTMLDFASDGYLQNPRINVRLVSGSLQVGDRLEICKPIRKTVFNRVNGRKTNIRRKYKLKQFMYKTITAEDITNIENGKTTISLDVEQSDEVINKELVLSYTNGSKRRAPRTVRITRPITKQGIVSYYQISNSVYVTNNFTTRLVKLM